MIFIIINLYVIDGAGICIYSYEFQRNVFVNEQLLSGFLSAITMFAQEAFQTGLHAIQIRNGQKMIFYLEQNHKLMFCAVADDKDNNRLLERILGEIAQSFVEETKDLLDSDNHGRIDGYKRFDTVLPEIVKNKTKRRDTRTMALGLIEGIGVLVTSSVITYLIVVLLRLIYAQDIVLILFLLILSSVLSLSSFVSGYTAGNPKFGVRNGLLFFILLNLIIVSINPILFLNFLYISPFVFICTAAAGYYGGLICDRTKLYPLGSVS